MDPVMNYVDANEVDSSHDHEDGENKNLIICDLIPNKKFD